MTISQNAIKIAKNRLRMSIIRKILNARKNIDISQKRILKGALQRLIESNKRLGI